MGKRAIYLLKFYLLTVLVFVIAKVVFMLVNSDGCWVMGEMCKVIAHGLSLDFSTALYIVALPFLVCMASVWVAVPRWLLKVYYLIVAVAFSLAFVADTSLYPFWHFKLNASCLQYLETPTEAMASVTIGYLLLRTVILILVSALIYKAYVLLGQPPSKGRHRLVETVCYVLLMPLIVIGIRGGLDESTTNVGQVYFSQNQFLNHSAVNPVFSFLSSFEKTANHIVDYDYYSQEECDRLMAGLYPTTSVGSDTLLNAQRPDIVIVLMESAGENMADAMPCLQQLKREGVSFSKCYANSWRTDRGTVCTYSGYPSFPTSSVMKMPVKSQHLPSIARTLRQNGYHTSYFYGGDINFTNMRSYLVGTGFEQLTWKKDFTSEEQKTAEWGVRDDLMFDAVYRQLTEHGDQAPQLIGFSTLSSHEPWDVPTHQLEHPVKNAFHYLDACVGAFVDKLRKTPWWKNTLIVLLPDHSIDIDGSTEAQQERNRIPMVWVGGAVKGHREIMEICNQTDLAATLLTQLGLSHDDFRWSRDVLSSTYQYPFAVHNYDNGYAVIDSTGFMVYDLDAQRMLHSESSQTQRLERMGKAILQATTKDLKEM